MTTNNPTDSAFETLEVPVQRTTSKENLIVRLRLKVKTLKEKLPKKPSLRGELDRLDARLAEIEKAPASATKAEIDELIKEFASLEEVLATLTEHGEAIVSLREKVDEAHEIASKAGRAPAAARFKKIEERLDALMILDESAAPGSFASKAIETTIEALRKETDEALDFLMNELARIDGVQRDQGVTLDTHTGQIGELSAGQQSHGVQLHLLDEGQQSLNDRVTVVESEMSGVNPLGPIIIGLIVGFGAWYLWLAHTFTGAPAANNPWAAVLAGAAVAGLAFGLSYSVWPSRKANTPAATVQPVHQDQPVTARAQEGAHHA